MSLKRPSRENGLTFLEIIMAIAIFSLVSAGVLFVFQRTLFVYRSSADKNYALQQAQTAAEWLLRDIQSAYGVAVAQINNTALVDPSQQYNRYYLDANQTIQRKECNNPSYLLAEGITGFTLKYYDAQNHVLSNPADNLSSLKTVQIDIIAKKDNQQFQLNSVARFEYDPHYSWVKAYGSTNDEMINSLQQASDGGYILGGATNFSSAGSADFFLVKTDVSGSFQWAKTYGGSSWDGIYSLKQTSDGGYILGGKTYSFGTGNYDFFLVKTDVSGTLQWAKTYGGGNDEMINSLQQASDGGYILGGQTLSFGVGNNDFFLVKTDLLGNLRWAKAYGGANSDILYSLQPTSDGGYILGGDTNSFGAGGADFFLVKTDDLGNLQWAKTYGGTNNDNLKSVQQTSDGGYVLGGYTSSFGVGDPDFLLVKTDASGNPLWAKTYGAADWDKMSSLQQTSDGGYILGGFSTSFSAPNPRNYDFFLVKTDASSILQWAKAYGGSGDDNLYSLQQTSDGGYVLGGGTDTASFGAGGTDYLVVKTDALGDLGCCGIDQVVTSSLSTTTAGIQSGAVTPTVTNCTTVQTKSHGSDFTVTTNSSTRTTAPVCPSTG